MNKKEKEKKRGSRISTVAPLVVVGGVGLLIWKGAQKSDTDDGSLPPVSLDSNDFVFDPGSSDPDPEVGTTLSQETEAPSSSSGADGTDTSDESVGEEEIGAKYSIEFDFDSIEELFRKLRELEDQGANIQGLLNLGNAQLAQSVVTRLENIREVIRMGYASGWEGWGDDDFAKVNSFLASVGFQGSVNRTGSQAILQQIASLDTFITTVGILVERAKSNPATIYGAPTLSFDAYELSMRDWDTATMNIKVIPLTPCWDNMFVFCPRHRINQNVTLRRNSAHSIHTGSICDAFNAQFANIRSSAAAWLAFLRDTRFNPNGKMALDSERGATAFESLGYDLNLMSPRQFSITSSNYRVNSGAGYRIIYDDSVRFDMVGDITQAKISTMEVKAIELSMTSPTISKLKRFLGIGNIGNYDLYFLENRKEDTGEGFEVSHFRATSRSSDITVKTHEYLFNEMEDSMSVVLYPQTYFKLGTAVESHNGRFFMVRRIGMIAVRGLKASNIQFVGEYQSGILTPTLDYRVLDSSQGLIFDVRSSTASDSPLRAFDSFVLILKEAANLSFKIVEDESALVIGQKKQINFQETSEETNTGPD